MKIAGQEGRTLIAEAVNEARGTADGETEETEGTATAEATDETGTEGSTEESTEEATEAAEGESEAQEGTDDVPTEYFGQDLSEFEPEVRKAIIDLVAPRDKHIQQLQREKAATTEKVAATPAPEPAAPVQDEEVNEKSVAEALGLDLEDPDDARTAKVAVPLAQLVLDLKDEVSELKTGVTVRETETYWTQGLNALESQYGKLPEGVTHDEVIRVAAENGIAEPMDAYWRIMGPARQAVMDEVRQRREAATKTLKKGSTQTKPRSNTETGPKKLESKTVRGGVAEVFEQLKRDGKFKAPYEDD